MKSHQGILGPKPKLRLSMLSGIGLVILAMTYACLPSAKAQGLLTYYNFNDQFGTSTSGSAANNATLASDAPGQQNTTISTTFAAANVVVFAGTTANQATGDTTGAGYALSLQVGTSNVNNGKYIQFSVNATGAVGTDNALTLSFATQKSGTTAFNTETLAYSTDGTTFTTFGTLSSIPTSFATSSFALPTFDNSVDLSTLTIRFTFTGGSSASSNVRLDNIQLNEVPEPATYFGGFLLVGVAGWSQRRRLLGLSRSSRT